MYLKNLSLVCKLYRLIITPLKCFHTNSRHNPAFQLPSFLQSSSIALNLHQGKQVHAQLILNGITTANPLLLAMYLRVGSFTDAKNLFYRMDLGCIKRWNLMIRGLVKMGSFHFALMFYFKLLGCGVSPDNFTFPSVVKACSALNYLHGLVVSCGLDSDSVVANTLLSMYSKCGWLSDGRKLFDMILQADLVSWNGMISGYVQNGFMEDALCLFSEMISSGVKPDSITLSSFLPAVTGLGSLRKGREIHGYILRHGIPLDVFLKSALVDVYLKCRAVDMARNIYNQSTKFDIVMCTAMISGYVLNGLSNDALEIFRWLLKEKIRPNAVTLASVLPACTDLAAIQTGKELHSSIIKNGLADRCHVGSAVIDMYAKCGRLDLAHRVFRRLTERDSVCWNSMITSCSQNGKPEEAINLFRQMGRTGTKYDCVSISAALSAIANLPALHFGKEIHGFMIKNSLVSDLFAESALIDMYAKCGHLDLAQHVFDMMELKNEVSWNSIIAAYGNHGHLKDCLALFDKMLKNKIQPDHVTFLAIISACGHAGKVNDGVHHFKSMVEEYGIPPRMEHYACMVDLLGRAGRLDEAFKAIQSMPFSPDAGVWGTLLGACRNQGNVELAEVASRHLFYLDPQNSGYYVLLSNLLADAGHWRSVLKVRSLMKERGVEKVPGYSWIEVNSTTHMFVAADGSHPQSKHIYSLLKTLLLELKREGYVPQLYLRMNPKEIVS
ncbi:hypothetical protein GOBAR_AA12322 [Gossypium barbadense]|uniref:DYW domain-containing protein n=1 Tax=Gossypium barbadense TaxID=3634 RepID=A0A2P5XYB1_GOSBA|nr:hypothetical protein GOBAR_AA12322 [Gossypium barbadense]